MENKENLTKERLDTEKIADYYKNLETEEANDEPVKITNQTNDEIDPYANEGYTQFVPKRTYYNGNLIADIAFVAAALLVAMGILLLSFYFGTLGVKDSELVEMQYSQMLSESSKYNDTLESISETNVQIEELIRERDIKQAEYDALLSYKNGEDYVEFEITELQKQLDTLNDENQKKQEQIDALTSDISEKVATIMNLPPGIYTVGESLAAGKYTVTGSGSILVASSNGNVKLNTILTADGVAVTLDDFDRIQLDTRAKFSPAA